MRLTLDIFGRVHRGPVCGFLVFWLPIATEHFAMLHHSGHVRSAMIHITKTRLFKYIENFKTKKGKFSDKKKKRYFS